MFVSPEWLHLIMSYNQCWRKCSDHLVTTTQWTNNLLHVEVIGNVTKVNVFHAEQCSLWINIISLWTVYLWSLVSYHSSIYIQGEFYRCGGGANFWLSYFVQQQVILLNYRLIYRAFSWLFIYVFFVCFFIKSYLSQLPKTQSDTLKCLVLSDLQTKIKKYSV